MPSQGSSWFPLPRRIPVRRGAGGNGATTVRAPAQEPLSEEEIRSAVVDCGLYEGGERLGGRIELESALRKADACQRRLRVDRAARPEPGGRRGGRRHFELHPLAVEDAVHAHQRAKLEVHGGDTLFVVLKTARYVDSDELIEIGEVMVFLGARFVVTVRHGEGSPLHDVRLDLEAHPTCWASGRARSSTRSPTASSTTTSRSSTASPSTSRRSRPRSSRARAPTRPSASTASSARCSSSAGRSRRSSAPMQRLSSKQAGLPLDPRTGEYFRDVHDHLLRDAERITGFDELLTNALQANVAQITMRDNQDMRRISAWVAIIAVPTMVFGLYGMNFKHMPELKLDLRLPGGRRRGPRHLRGPVPQVQAHRLALSIVEGSIEDVDALEPLWVAVHHAHAASMPELAPTSATPRRRTSAVYACWPARHLPLLARDGATRRLRAGPRQRCRTRWIPDTWRTRATDRRARVARGRRGAAESAAR